MSTMLSSWKEIAQFFGKGVRTVQRWEKTLGLPIHRPAGAPSNVVLARTSDLEAWMHRSAPAAVLAESASTAESSDLDLRLVELEDEVKYLEAQFSQAGNEQGPEEVGRQEQDVLVNSIGDRLSNVVNRLRNLKKHAPVFSRFAAGEDRSLTAVVEGLPWPAMLLDASLRPIVSNAEMHRSFGREWMSAFETQPFPGPMDGELGRQVSRSLERGAPAIYHNDKFRAGAATNNFTLHINPIILEDNSLGLLLMYAPQKAKVRSQIAA